MYHYWSNIYDDIIIAIKSKNMGSTCLHWMVHMAGEWTGICAYHAKEGWEERTQCTVYDQPSRWVDRLEEGQNE